MCCDVMTGKGGDKSPFFFYFYMAILEGIKLLFIYHENPIETVEFKKRNRAGDVSDDKGVLP